MITTACTAETPRDTDRERFCHLRQLGLELNCFFDVGASNGCWSHRVSCEFPDANFELFEPLIEHVPNYQRVMDWTLSQHPNFHLHKIALGAECRPTTMYLPEHPVGSTALDLEDWVPHGWRPVQVQMATIDSLVKLGGLPLPQAIKIDTQGCELNILKGAHQTLPQVQVLLLECWLARGYGKSTPLLLEVALWLRDFHFYLCDFGEAYRDKAGNLVSQDCFFLNARNPVSRLRQEMASPPEPAQARNGHGRWLKRMRNLLAKPL